METTKTQTLASFQASAEACREPWRAGASWCVRPQRSGREPLGWRYPGPFSGAATHAWCGAAGTQAGRQAGPRSSSSSPSSAAHLTCGWAAAHPLRIPVSTIQRRVVAAAGRMGTSHCSAAQPCERCRGPTAAQARQLPRPRSCTGHCSCRGTHLQRQAAAAAGSCRQGSTGFLLPLACM